MIGVDRILQILTTALFSVTMLRRTLTGKKWIALVLLTIGVAIVQLPASGLQQYTPVKGTDSKFYFPRSFHELGQISNGAVQVAAELTKRGMSEVSGRLMKRSATYEGIEEDLGLVKPAMSYSLGCTAVLVAAVISGLTGVYFEKVLKDSSNREVSVWTRNVQLSFYSLFPSLILGVFVKDGGEIAQNGFFAGYNSVVWTAICFQALGGVLVAMCINYADNIAKNFATSISIIISFLFSVWFFDFQVTANVSRHTLYTPKVTNTDIFRTSSSLVLLWSFLQHIFTVIRIGKGIDHHPSILQAMRRRL